MVRQGVLEVQLIHAETMIAFQEHEGAVPREAEDPCDHDHPATMTYVEVEPNAQYWIRLESHLLPTTTTAASPSNPTAATTSPPMVGRCEIDVDGRHLGYHVYLQGNERQDVGIWSRQGCQETHRALQFIGPCEIDERNHPAKRYRRDYNHKYNDEFWIGTIRIRLYEAIPILGTNKPVKDFHNAWKGGRYLHPIQRKFAHRKRVLSTPGTRVVAYDSNQDEQQHQRHQEHCSVPAYRQGSLLQCIELRYCTTYGLIRAGILPERDFWEMRRLIHPTYQTSDPEIAKLQPTKIRISHNQFGPTITWNCDIFDLTHLTSHEDGDDDDDDDNRVDSGPTNGGIQSEQAGRIIWDRTTQQYRYFRRGT